MRGRAGRGSTCARAAGGGGGEKAHNQRGPPPPASQASLLAACSSNVFCFCVVSWRSRDPATRVSIHSFIPGAPTSRSGLWSSLPSQISSGPVKASAGGFLNRLLVALLWSKRCESLPQTGHLCEMRKFVSTTHSLRVK